MGKASKLETREKITVQVQRQSAGEPERVNAADEVARQSADRIPSCSGEVSLLFYSGFQLIVSDLASTLLYSS